MSLNLYLLKQSEKHGYDFDYETYDSCVVVAKSSADARLIHPSLIKEGMEEYHFKWDGEKWKTQNSNSADDSWADPNKLDVIKIGTANWDAKEGTVIIASFNAG